MSPLLSKAQFGLLVGLVIGLAAAFGGFGAFVAVVLFGAIGLVVGLVLDGRLDLGSVISNRKS